MADVKLPPGMKLDIAPQQDYTPKLPPGMTLDDAPQTGNAPQFKPGGIQDFFGTLAEDAGQFIPNLAHTAKSLAKHPIDTGMAMGKGLLNLPDTLSDEWEKEGRPGKAVAHLTELGAPMLMKGAGALMKAPAPTLAESALGIRGLSHAYGATPGKAILEETSGLRPSTIEASARGRINTLSPQLDRAVSAATTPIQLTSPRNLVTNEWMRAAGEGNVPLTKQIEEMGDALSRNRVTDTPYGPSLTPREALDLKRGIGDEFATYNPNIHERANALAKNVRGDLNTQIHAASPEAANIDQRISSLIPVSERARATSLNAGPGQRIMDRMTRPTGAMLPALFGLKEAGLSGLFGAIAGQEATASPVVKMMGARTLFNTGRAAQTAGRFSTPLVMGQPELTRRQP